MPPLREQDPAHIAKASTSKPKPISDRRRRKKVEKASNGVPGVQKIKAALRQAQRLLAKEKLAANLRVETERRLKVLEADLQAAELTRKERTLAIRYHRVKFFERQKVTRKIKQVQNRLCKERSKSEKKKLKSELQELRIDLNYIFHYPKLRKYISLFPPEVRKGDAVSALSQSEVNVEREDTRIWIRECMERGELPSEPELEVTIGLDRKNEPPLRGSRSKDGVDLKSKSFEQKGIAEEDEFFVEDNDEEDATY